MLDINHRLVLYLCFPELDIKVGEGEIFLWGTHLLLEIWILKLHAITKTLQAAALKEVYPQT